MAKGTKETFRTNEQIRVPQIRLIDHENQQVGIVDTHEALRMARDADMDLVEVARTERPPVCRIMDYGKFKYHMKKKVRKTHHEQQLKEVRMRPKTDDNDRSIKLNRALKFLSKGDKVQFTMQFRGRERAHREVAYAIFRGIVEELGELVKVERAPSMDGRHMIMIASPNKPVFEKLRKEGKLPSIEDLMAEREQREEEEAAAEEAAEAAAAPEGQQ